MNSRIGDTAISHNFARRLLLAGLSTLVIAGLLASALAQSIPNNFPLPDATGWLTTNTTAGSIDLTNPFFQNLGPSKVAKRLSD